jgi:hypothetical protein
LAVALAMTRSIAGGKSGRSTSTELTGVSMCAFITWYSTLDLNGTLPVSSL